MSRYFTVEQWYNSVPDLNVREKLFTNVEPHVLRDSSTEDLPDAICEGFTLRNSPEGYDYWLDMMDKLNFLKIKPEYL